MAKVFALCGIEQARGIDPEHEAHIREHVIRRLLSHGFGQRNQMTAVTKFLRRLSARSYDCAVCLQFFTAKLAKARNVAAACDEKRKGENVKPRMHT
jgi:hypothetical protein